MHLGTLLAALGSYLQARSQNGIWHVRIDDIDPPREVTGAADSILRTLEAYGLHWDAAVIYQSQRHDAYQTALHQLMEQGDVFHCACSRKAIDKMARIGPCGAIYPGSCRDKKYCADEAKAIRLRTTDQTVAVDDLIQGSYALNIQKQVGDYIVKRSDGLFAYHLATVVDDGLDGYTEIVRGQDLLSLTPQQIYLQQRLGIATPRYAHLPLLMNRAGIKFSKRAGAQAVDNMPQGEVMKTLLETLGMDVADDLDLNNISETLDWALQHWKLAQVPAASRIIR